MKATLRRATVLYIFAACFFAALIALIADIAVNGAAWSSNRANRHIYSSGQTVNAGTIFDRNGKVLAISDDSERKFPTDAVTRKSTLHIVGDTAGFISTGAHSLHRDTLSGYSFWNGIYTLKDKGKGSDLTLNIDAEACKIAYNALGSYNGAVAVYNYKTGELLCSVSKPTYDVYDVPGDILTNEKYDGVYLDKVISGLYTPGSVMKIVTAVCAIENIPDLDSRTFVCEGKQVFADGSVKCNDTHGEIDFATAFVESCNSVFSQLAVELGAQRLNATATALGFNTRLLADDVRLAMSTFKPSTVSRSELGWAGIGQSTTLLNPCHMLMITGAIANGGTCVPPRRVKGSSLIQLDFIKKPNSKGITIQPATAARLRDMLREAVRVQYGDSRFPNLEMCGKTGTAQIDNKQAHSWFAGFSLREDLPLAVVCVAENAGAGAGTAINVANKVLQHFATN